MIVVETTRFGGDVLLGNGNHKWQDNKLVSGQRCLVTEVQVKAPGCLPQTATSTMAHPPPNPVDGPPPSQSLELTPLLLLQALATYTIFPSLPLPRSLEWLIMHTSQCI